LQVEKTLDENKDKLEEADVTATQDALEKAKQAIKDHADNAQELQKATEELLQASHKVAEILYKQQQGAQAQGDGQATGAPENNNDNAQQPNNEQGPIDAEINN